MTGESSWVSVRIREQAERRPDAVAVTFEGKGLPYREVLRLADSVRHMVREAGAGAPDVPVGVLLPRSVALVAAPLGIMDAGAAYVPLPLGANPARLAKLIDDCGARHVVTTAEHAAQVTGHGAAPLVLDEPPTGQIAAPSPAPAGKPEDLAYVLYTSGSTGEPKGIMMPRGALHTVVDWQLASTARHLDGEPLRAVQFTPLTFDVSFLEIFCTLAAGGTVIMPTEAERQDPATLFELMLRERATSVFLPHITLHTLAEVAVRRARTDGAVLALREVMTGGEQLLVTPVLVDWFRTMPRCTLQNIYGPSEAHVVTTHDLSGDPATWPATPPIGRALPGVTLRVLDGQLKEVPAGEQGELCVSGDCLARGYLRRPQQEAERFVTDPATGARVYRTGDIVRDLGDGVLQYLGRADDQVKIRGALVEPSGTEAVLAQHPDVESCAVVAVPGVDGAKRLVAYVVPRDSRVPPSGEPVTRQADPVFQRFLQAELPEQAIPETYVFLTQMPQGASGKIDRKALPAPAVSRPELAVGYVPPRSPLEVRVAGIWAELLQVDRIGIDDPFFDVGGHSLLLVRLQARLADALAVEVRIADLLGVATVRGLCALLERRRADVSADQAGGPTSTGTDPGTQAGADAPAESTERAGNRRVKFRATAQRRRSRGG